MYDLWSNRLGRLDDIGGTFVETEFFALRGLPLFPRCSRLVLEENRRGEQRVIPLPLQRRSVMAAYARTYILPFVLILSFQAYFADLRARDVDAAEAMGESLLSVALAAVWGVAFGWVGHLSAEQRAQRRVYARFAGHPVDVGLLAEASCHHDLATALRARIADRAAALASGYRELSDPEARWQVLALDPHVKDGELLGAALTLARLESRLATGAASAELGGVHAQIWDRMRRAELARPEEPTPTSPTGRWDSPIMSGIVVAAAIGVAALGFHKRQPPVAVADLEVASEDVGQPFAPGATLQAGDAVVVLVEAPDRGSNRARAAEVVTKLNDEYVLVRYLPSGRRDTVARTSLRQKAR